MSYREFTIRAGLRSTRAWLRGFALAERGGFAVWFAAMVPAISAVVVGAVELQALRADHSVMQDVADAAALSGAKELATGQAGVTARTKAYADQQLALLATRYEAMDVTATLGGDGHSVVVMIDANRLSFFGNMLPPGGFRTVVRSTASSMNQQQLCVLTLDAAKGDILVNTAAKLLAPGCMVHSARNMTTDGTSSLSALAAQAVGTASGTILPAKLGGAPAIADPFSALTMTFPSCTASQFHNVETNAMIGAEQIKSFETSPGVYHLCGDFELAEGANVTLPKGAYYFVGVPDDAKRVGSLKVKKGATLTGDGVTLLFDRTSKIKVESGGTLSLKAPTTGTYAGMLLMAPASNDKQFALESDAVDLLEGVIYLPGAELYVTGGRLNETAKWTITVTKTLTVKSASLEVASDYASSTIPVPGAVRAGTGEVRLTPNAAAATATSVQPL